MTDDEKTHILLAVLLIVSMMPLSACNLLQAEPETTTQNESVLTLGEESLLLTDSVSTNESLIEIAASGNFPGLTILVPEGAFSETESIEVSSADIEAHNLGDGVETLTPLIRIETTEEQLNKALTLTIPVTVPEGQIPLAFYYNAETGDFEAIPSQLQENGTFTICSSHFSSLLVTSVMETLLLEEVTTDFVVGRDNLQIPNLGVYRVPGGICHGIAEATLFYYKTLRSYQELCTTITATRQKTRRNSGRTTETFSVWRHECSKKVKARV